MYNSRTARNAPDSVLKKKKNFLLFCHRLLTFLKKEMCVMNNRHMRNKVAPPLALKRGGYSLGVIRRDRNDVGAGPTWPRTSVTSSGHACGWIKASPPSSAKKEKDETLPPFFFVSSFQSTHTSWTNRGKELKQQPSYMYVGEESNKARGMAHRSEPFNTGPCAAGLVKIPGASLHI